MRQRHIIGIAGGLGPFAHIDFERKLLDAARELLDACADQDFPEWIVSSVPQTPDRTQAIAGAAADPLPYLIRSLRRLERGDGESPGAGFAVIPCNSAHQFLPQVRERVTIPIIDMLEETANAIAERWPGARAGLLATTGTVTSGLYARALAALGIEAVTPLQLPDGESIQRDHIMGAIYGPWNGQAHTGGGIKSHGGTPGSARLLEGVSELLVSALGANVIIAGCTEIPLALTGATVAGVPLVDPGAVVARASIRRAYGIP